LPPDGAAITFVAPPRLTLRTRGRYSGDAMPSHSTDRPSAHKGPLYQAPRGTSDVLPAEQPYWRLALIECTKRLLLARHRRIAAEARDELCRLGQIHGNVG